MGMGAGLQPPRLGRTHPSGELLRPSKGPQSPQDAAWGTCPRPPCLRSCAGPERLPRGHLFSPRPTAAGGGRQPGPQTQHGLAWTGPGAGLPRTLAAQSLCPGQDCPQHRARPASQRCPQVSTGQRPAPPQQHQEGCQPGSGQRGTPRTPPGMVGLAPRGHPPRVTRDATAPWTEGAE